jgi:amidohydrolase
MDDLADDRNGAILVGDIMDVIAWRRELHAIPETGFEEVKTAAFVADRLSSFGLEVHAGIGGTGVVGVLRRGSDGQPGIGLRAELDALNIAEANDIEHASRHAGKMHACGHDGHMAMLLGAARELSQSNEIERDVYFVFQPAEEHGHGARAMIDDGLFERFGIAEIHAIHNEPGLPVGSFATCEGPISGNEDNFRITLTGAGGHAAVPNLSNDPVVAGCSLVLGLQAIVSRRADPMQASVVSVTGIATDGERNILPGRITISGDARSFTPEVSALIEREMRRISAGVAEAYGLELELDYTHDFAAAANDAEATHGALDAANQVFGASNVDGAVTPSPGADDFGLFLRHVPGNYAFVGNGTDGRCGRSLHSATYEFNDDVLPWGIRYWVELATRRRI